MRAGRGDAARLTELVCLEATQFVSMTLGRPDVFVSAPESADHGAVRR
jgi:hypothetical protein